MKAGRFDHQHDEDDSPVSASGDEETYAAPSPKKSKRGAHKRVVTVPINDGGGFRSKGEVYAPSDSWSWRKYGQKPIKGSPYPRGYYRCSSSKGCPARKQVERSRHDPTTLLITYACDHNHPLPAATTRTHCHRPAAAKLSPPSPPSTPDDPLQDECAVFAELAVELGWLCGVGSTMMEGAGTLVGPVCAHVDVGEFGPIGEEDRVLFGDLGDLPESAVVARWCRGGAPGNNAFGCQCHRAH